MSSKPNRLRQVVDWRAAILAGILAGIALVLMYALIVPRFFEDDTTWSVLRGFAGRFTGDTGPDPATAFHMSALIGAAIMLALAVPAAILLAVIIYHWGIIVGFLGGAAYGLALYAISVLGGMILVPHLSILAIFVAFGAIAGTLYEMFEVEIFVPDDDAPARSVEEAHS